MTCGSEAARNRRWLLGQGCLAWLAVGAGSKLCFCVATSLCCECKRRGRRESPQAFEPGKGSTRREVGCSWFLESSYHRLRFGKDSSGWLTNCPSCVLMMRQEELLSYAIWLQPVGVCSMRGCHTGTPELLPLGFFWVPEAA